MTNEEVISRLKQLLVTKRNVGDLLDVEAISCALNVFEEWDYNIKLSALELEQQLRDCKTCKHSDNGNCSGTEECHECMWESKYEQQPCKDCVSREEFERRIKPYDTEDKTDKAIYNFAHNILISCPSVTPQPKIGKWIVHPKGIGAHLVCNKCLSNAPYDCKTNYCPKCGAKMEVNADND